MAEQDSLLVEQQLKFCMGILNKLKRNQNAGPFLKPVDAVALGIPDYPEKIKHPMDISTVRKKLETNAYAGPEEFNSDMVLMFNNCYVYNAPGSVVHEMGRDLQRVYESYYQDMPAEVVKRQKAAPSPKAAERARRTPRDGMGAEEHAYCAEVLCELEKPKHRGCVWPFAQPVTEKDAPGYFEVVKSPMDLSTVRRKLESACYGTAQEFNDDLELIVENCYRFNAPETEVYRCCKEFEKVVKGLVARQRDPDARINELRRKISQLTAELREAERQKSQTRRVYSLSERERIGQSILKMSRPQVEHVAEIVQRHCAYEYVDNDEIELNLNTMPDEVLNEINEYIMKMNSTDAEGGAEDSGDSTE